VPKDEFLNHKSSFDGFTEPDIIRDQQIHPWHRKRAHYWIKLVLIDLDSTTEGGV
jgi:hypothetical protein